MKARSRCPRCGGPLVIVREGIFGWRACRDAKGCGWTVFNHGDDPRDREGERS